MNGLVRNPLATVCFDGMSGGFKYSDEFPERLMGTPEELDQLLPWVTMLRILWGHRVSLVLGAPRSDLEVWWKTVQQIAPQWPGFSEDRCSTLAVSLAEWCEEKSSELIAGLEELSDRMEGKRN